MKTILILLGTTAPAFAAEYYVATTGNDNGSGNIDQPFRTIARGLALARMPGDNVIVREGIYRQRQTLNLVNAGKKGEYITLRAFTGEKTVIDGTLTPKDANLVAVMTHHVRIKGMIIRNANSNGIAVWGPGTRVHDIQLIGNTIHHCHRSGIYVGVNSLSDPVRDVLAESNTVHHAVLMNQQPSRKSWSFALGTGLSKNVTIRNNVVYQSYGEGVGFYLSDRGVAEGNVVHDNFSVNLYLDNATHCRIRRNLVYSTGEKDFFRFDHPAAGIQVANENYGKLSNPSSHNEITSNILIGNSCAFCYGSYQRGGGLRHTVFSNNTAYGSTGALLRIDGDNGHQNSRIVNNIFRQIGRVPMTDISTMPDQIAFGNNLWHGGIPQEPARSADDVSADPRFINSGTHDPIGYQLRSNSPAQCRRKDG